MQDTTNHSTINFEDRGIFLRDGEKSKDACWSLARDQKSVRPGKKKYIRITTNEQCWDINKAEPC